MTAAKANAEAKGTGDPHQVFTTLRMSKPVNRETGTGRELLFSAGNKAGFWGAWICHLGILLLILGFALGQMTAENYTVYALPVSDRQIRKDDRPGTGQFAGTDRIHRGRRGNLPERTRRGHRHFDHHHADRGRHHCAGRIHPCDHESDR